MPQLRLLVLLPILLGALHLEGGKNEKNKSGMMNNYKKKLRNSSKSDTQKNELADNKKINRKRACLSRQAKQTPTYTLSDNYRKNLDKKKESKPAKRAGTTFRYNPTSEPKRPICHKLFPNLRKITLFMLPNLPINNSKGDTASTVSAILINDEQYAYFSEESSSDTISLHHNYNDLLDQLDQNSDESTSITEKERK